MGSEKEGTGYQQPESPKLCANNCGFFGTAATMNLCSKCYRDLRLIEEQEASAKSAVRKSLRSQEQQQQQQQRVICASVDDFALPWASSSSRLDLANSSAAAVESGDVVVEKNRCFSCNKRVGLTGFKCRCGNTFCGTHRYAEKHDCCFDYKNAAREAIARDNPALKLDKLERI